MNNYLTYYLLSDKDDTPIGLFEAYSAQEAQNIFNKFNGNNNYQCNEISKSKYDKYLETTTEDLNISDLLFEEDINDEGTGESMYFAIWKLDDSHKDFPVSLFVSDSISAAINKFNQFRNNSINYKLSRISQEDYARYYKYIYSENDYKTMQQAEISRELKKDHPNILFSVSSVRNFFESNTKARHMIEKDYNQSIYGLNKDELVSWISDHRDILAGFKVELGLPNFNQSNQKDKKEESLQCNKIITTRIQKYKSFLESINDEFKTKEETDQQEEAKKDSDTENQEDGDTKSEKFDALLDKCRNMYDILISGIKQHKSSMKLETLVKSMFKTANGSCTCVNQCNDTKLFYDGKINNYSIRGTIEKASQSEDLLNLIYNLLMGYNVSLGGSRINLESFIDKLDLNTNIIL